MKIYNQLDYPGVKFGTKKDTGVQNDIHGWGCKLTCFAIILQMDPVEVDKIFVKNGVYSGTNGNLIDDTAAARALGWQFLGRESDINKMPGWEPTIKEVDFSRAEGKQQHFVVRMLDKILDPYEGVERAKNYYENKVGSPNWEGGRFSYRLFKVPETQTPVPNPCDDCLKERDALKSENAVLKGKISEAIKILQS